MYPKGLFKHRRSSIGVIFITILLFFLPGIMASGQSTIRPDSVIHIRRGSYVQLADTLMYFKNDTTIKIPPYFLKSRSRTGMMDRAFYDSLKTKAERTLVTRALFDIVVIEPKKTLESNRFATDNVSQYENLIIRKISIRQLEVFGTSITDPDRFEDPPAGGFLNSIHYDTRSSIISRYISFKSGDSISASVISENERILRTLPFIDDAVIIVVPVSDSIADIAVVTKDKFSLGMDLSLTTFRQGSVSVFEKNLAGTGHSFELILPFNFDRSPLLGYGANYGIRNVYGTFSDIELSFLDNHDFRSYGISLRKEFLRLSTRYAGGLTVRDTYRSEDLDTLPSPEPFRVNYQDLWAGRSFTLNEDNGSRIFIHGRYTFNNVIDRPGIPSDAYYKLQKYKLYLGSLSWSKRKFYKSSLIYSYGRTEDISTGLLFSLKAGYEQNEFKQRGYAGVTMAAGFYPVDLGYISSSISVSSFIKAGKREQGVLNMQLNYFTNLMNVGTFKLRGFLNTTYSHGYNRYGDEYLYLKSKYSGLRGFENDSVAGNDRVTISGEAVLFSPSNIYGFRFAFFTYTDIGLLAGRAPVMSISRELYSIGLGVRIRNDNLVFNTFQLRFGYFLNPPPYSILQHIAVSSERTQNVQTFDPGPPGVTPFR